MSADDDTSAPAPAGAPPERAPPEMAPPEMAPPEMAPPEMAPPEMAVVKLRAPAKVAGGLKAVASSMRHLRRETGMLRGSLALLEMNQVEGFDCPGCAWPESADERARIEFCENGAKALAEEATTKRATPEVFAARSVEELRALSDFELGQLGRITHPMLLDEGATHYRAVSWEQAFEVLASEIRTLASPDQAVFYTSGRTSNEAAFLYQLFGRLLGTNNFPDCSNMCHESSGVGLTEVIGVGKGTVSLEDFAEADAIFVIGQNPGTNHPRMLTTLREAARRGAVIVSVNPLREPGMVRFAHPQKVGDLFSNGVALAREHLQVRIGGDVALLQGIAKEVLAEEERRPGQVLDHEFLARHTVGFEAWRAAVLAADWERIVEDAGVSREQIRRAAEIYLEAKAVIVCWAMGLTQHKHAVHNVQEIVNLLLLRGNIGRPGAGPCPVRGHSNVQGDRTVGIDHRPGDVFLDRLGAVIGFAPPRGPGLDVVDSIHAMLDGKVRVFVAMGGNFYSASPDSPLVGRALAGCAVTAHVSTKVNRSHLYPGRRALILPCLGRSEIDVQAGGEQFVTVEDSMSVVHRSRGTLAPAGAELRSEPAIVAGLARASLGARSKVDWDALSADYDAIRDLIAQVVPGCDDYNRRVRDGAGFVLPRGARDRDFSAVIGGRARFTACPLPDLSLPPGRLRLMTMRSHDQYNTTIYGLDDRYRGVFGERRVVFVHRDDLTALGLVERQLVDVISEHAGTERRVARFIAVPYDIPRGNAAAYFPEANPLVSLDSQADGSGTPTSKNVIIRIEPSPP